MLVPGRLTLLRLKNLYNRISFKYVSQQTPRNRPLSSTGGKRLSNYLLLTFPATTFCLGTWQIKRYKWKQELIQKLEGRLSLPPIDLPEDSSEMENLEYFRVKLRGKFDHSKEMVISPRQDYSPNVRRGPYPEQGGHIVVPFELTDSKRRILVNRGFVPSQQIPPANRLEGQVTDEVEVTGVIRKSDKVSRFLKGMNKPLKYGYFMGRDIKLMSQLAQTEPIFIDAELSSTVKGGPKGGQTIVKLRDEHLQYIFVWYTLTAYMLYRWVKFNNMPKLNMIKTLQSKF
ncbi:hypothetical protein LOTGIDRAFT_185379 [Lottia gigantea]|uniref:SURF1-like protein n=1 Tax=Lottia gigantea TaxID=225164 RepID=V4AIQ0_LOTGI|nr:hypothetical protein LOTGIDRAFT_185379 [Lottia gigantea]ESP03984.1 hypothetical protein LOTGIDRAFT_185379 [Lottia gigantea]